MEKLKQQRELEPAAVAVVLLVVLCWGFLEVENELSAWGFSRGLSAALI